MSKSPKNVQELFKKHRLKGHEILDSKDNPIRVGDTVFNAKTNEEIIIDRELMFSLDFGVEVLGFKNMAKLTVVNTLESVSESRVIAFEEDEEDEEDFDCGCTIEPEKTAISTSKDLESLKKLFDSVEIVVYEKYQTLIIKDISTDSSMDWMVWLNVKIAVSHDANRKSSHTTDKYMNGALKKVNDYAPLLTKFKNEKNLKQVSLFDDTEGDEDKEIILEEEPSSPSDSNGGSDKGWGLYFNKREAVRKRNIIKLYEFFDVVDFNYSWFSARDENTRRSMIEKLPQTSLDLIELIKENIIKITKDDRLNHGRFYGIWWDNSCQYLKVGSQLSDVELISRVQSIMRLQLLPYIRRAYVSPDDSYTIHVQHEDKTQYRYYFDYGVINASFSEKIDMGYDLHEKEFILWLREWFSIEYKEALTDKDAIAISIVGYYKNITENFDFISAIKSVVCEADYIKIFNSKEVVKTFKKDSGESLPLDDGFGGYVSYDGGKKDSIRIHQQILARMALGREIPIDADEKKMQLFSMEGIESIHRMAFEIYCNREAIEEFENQGQGSLF